MNKQITPLMRFWMALNWEFNQDTMPKDESFEHAMLDCEYEPIDTRFCMVKTPDAGWFLLEASGSVIIRATECGEMENHKAKN